MYKAMDIAQYIINKSIIGGMNISNLKLQKILYYIQAAFMVERGNPCYSDAILNWRHGPVVKEVYDEYKQYGNSNINDTQKGYTILDIDDDFTFKYKNVEYREENICEEDKEIIDNVINSKITLDAWDLVKLTHEEIPWQETNQNDTISNESIREYFENNIDRIFGEG